MLDEATAMFDPEGEKSFIADCHDTLARRTVILITHRPASLALADRVLRLEGAAPPRNVRVPGHGRYEAGRALLCCKVTKYCLLRLRGRNMCQAMPACQPKA
ncbi:hypothetical protein [Candidatus Skiveiella danica]|uniref:hypothetical protein n=1 Tax=Candidatus Skiveiella danica TaxID=3386177 RepID=UPI0039B8EF2B